MAIIREAYASWRGGLKDGSGSFSSGGISGAFDFHSRFEDGEGTNPEELLGAALASCFSMALAANLEKAGLNPQMVETRARVILDRLENGWTVVKIVLHTRVSVDGMDYEALRKLAEETKRTCPIGKALMAVPVIELKLERVQGPS